MHVQGSACATGGLVERPVSNEMVWVSHTFFLYEIANLKLSRICHKYKSMLSEYPILLFSFGIGELESFDVRSETFFNINIIVIYPGILRLYLRRYLGIDNHQINDPRRSLNSSYTPICFRVAEV